MTTAVLLYFDEMQNVNVKPGLCFFGAVLISLRMHFYFSKCKNESAG